MNNRDAMELSSVLPGFQFRVKSGSRLQSLFFG